MPELHVVFLGIPGRAIRPTMVSGPNMISQTPFVSDGTAASAAPGDPRRTIPWRASELGGVHQGRSDGRPAKVRLLLGQMAARSLRIFAGAVRQQLAWRSISAPRALLGLRTMGCDGCLHRVRVFLDADVPYFVTDQLDMERGAQRHAWRHRSRMARACSE